MRPNDHAYGSYVQERGQERDSWGEELWNEWEKWNEKWVCMENMWCRERKCGGEKKWISGEWLCMGGW